MHATLTHQGSSALAMAGDRATDKYLAQYSLQLGSVPPLPQRWQHVMVVPCYDEAPNFIHTWQNIYRHTDLLILLVLNRPEGSESTANEPVRQALSTYSTTVLEHGYSLSQLSDVCSVLCVDLERLEGPTPTKEGVGRARRIGCDLALKLQQTQVIHSQWIYSGDADAIWPAAMFNTQWPNEASAVTVPFRHRFDDANPPPSSGELSIAQATQIYELKIHHYVLHLQAMNSPYGFHALGSSCLFKGCAYAAVRGMPLRCAAEDFYILNKLAKIGPVHTAQGAGITITPRLSTRVPFGTGPAVEKLLSSKAIQHEPLFYDARCFDILGRLSHLFELWTASPQPNTYEHLTTEFGSMLAEDLHTLLSRWGYQKVLTHIYQAGATSIQRKRHTITWLDGFKTLKIIHLLRDRHFPNVSCMESLADPRQWPIPHDGTTPGLLQAIYQHLGWFQRGYSQLRIT